MTTNFTRKACYYVLILLLTLQLLPVHTRAAEKQQPQKNFSDVTLYEKEVNQLVELGIINGYPDQTFKPNQPITRAHGVAMLLRELKVDTTTTVDPQFTDISKDHLYYNEIATAYHLGIISGYPDGTFGPDKELSRAQMAKILANAYKLELKKIQIPFKDVSPSHWAYEYIQKLATNGMTTGFQNGTFQPEQKLTRMHFSLFLVRYINEVKKPKEQDPQTEPPNTESPSPQNPGNNNVTVKIDTDGDGIPNEEEKSLGTNPNLKDTDGDGLTDGEEVYLYSTNPLKQDTDEDGLLDAYEVAQNDTIHFNPTLQDSDGNGIHDSEEDLDNDGLRNIDEVKWGTDPKVADSDFDQLLDGKEVEMGTNPLKEDTDGDGLLDGEEAPLGFDPLKEDTDGNGIIDGQETIQAVSEPTQANQTETVNPTITISTAASNENAVTMTSLESDPFLHEGIPGYLGPAFDFETEIPFDEAQMTFTYDESVVTESFRPEIFYYNEKDQRLERLPNQTHDPETNTVTTTVNHFSKYILLNGMEWDRVWEREIRPPGIDQSGNLKNLDVVFSIDSSGSMSDMDPQGLRKTTTSQFVDALRETDRSAVVDFDSYSQVLVSLTTDKEQVKAKISTIDDWGGTNIYKGVQSAIDEIKTNSSPEHLKYIILLTDGDGTWKESALQEAKEQGITIFTIGLGNGVNQTLLQRIAAETGGKYFFATDAVELQAILKETAAETIDYTIDEDEGLGDGIPDYLEREGLRVGNGEVFKTDPMKRDTDGDGLLDGEEITVFYDENDGKVYFKMFSDPLQKDTDGDGINDNDEPRDQRMTFNVTPKHALMFSELSYIDMEDSMETTTDLTKLAKFSHKHVDPASELKNWKLIKANDNENGFFGSGFSAIAAKRGDTIVIAYRGSDTAGAGDIWTDWIKTNADILVDGDTPQLKKALKFAAEIVHDYDTSKIHVVGHSMGGFNAQVASYHMKENTLDEVYGWFNSNRKKKIRNALAKGNFQLTRTFNSAPFFSERALDPLSIDMNTSTSPAVPLNIVWGSSYDNKVYNYQMSFDVLHVLGQYLPSEKLGKDFTPFNYQLNNRTYTYEDINFQELVNIIEEYEAEKGQIDASNRIELARELSLLAYWINKQSKNDAAFKQRLDDLNAHSSDMVHAHGLSNFYPYVTSMQ